MIMVRDQPGSLYQLTRVIWEHRANIDYVDLSPGADGHSRIYLELKAVASQSTLLHDIGALDVVESVEQMPTFALIYGKRVIVIGGGAQVGQVALGAISE